MPTAILDKLLQSQFGKSFIMWVFLAMCAGITALGWLLIVQAGELKACNAELVASEKSFGLERERIVREQVEFYKNILHRLDAVEKKRK